MQYFHFRLKVPIKDEIREGKKKSYIEELKEKHAKQDLEELFCSVSDYKEKMEILEKTCEEEAKNLASDGGALWDIFRREDVPKLEEYLKKHHTEFRHFHCSPVSQVQYPLHTLTLFFSCLRTFSGYFVDIAWSALFASSLYVSLRYCWVFADPYILVFIHFLLL